MTVTPYDALNTAIATFLSDFTTALGTNIPVVFGALALLVGAPLIWRKVRSFVH